MTGIYREDDFADQTREVKRERVENYDVIRRHDIAVMNYFDFWVPYHDTETGKLMEKMVPMVFASPRREVSERDIHTQTDEKRTAMEWEGDFAPTQLERLVYPNIAVTRLDMTFDQTRFTYAPWRKLLYSDDLNLVLEANFPLPYNFTYQFDFWVLNQSELNMMVEQFARKFPQPVYYVDVQFPPPWDTQGVHMESQGVFSNTSILEGSEQQREIRGVATVNLYGWIPLPTSWVRTVQKISIELIEQESLAILEIAETEYADKPAFWETGDKDQVLEWK